MKLSVELMIGFQGYINVEVPGNSRIMLGNVETMIYILILVNNW